MIEAIKIDTLRRGHNRQSIGVSEESEWITISSLIQRIEDWYYQIKKLKYNIEVFNLRSDSFSCDSLFEFLVHCKKIEDANLKYPIIINNEWQVIDGRHRICKAILQGDKEIDAIQILDSTII